MKNMVFLIVLACIAGVILLNSFSSRQTVIGDIGDIRYSVIRPEVFERKNPGWKLMDGRAMEQNWDLYKLYTTEGLLNDPQYSKIKDNLPDARGVFVRGMNSGRGADSGDTDPARVVGDLQIDEFKSHDHDMSFLSRTGDIVGFQNTSGGGDPIQRLAWGDRLPYGGAKRICLRFHAAAKKPDRATLPYIFI